jgi:hypothetical protein
LDLEESPKRDKDPDPPEEEVELKDPDKVEERTPDKL